jgi:RNA polymerase sigma-54 factor
MRPALQLRLGTQLMLTPQLTQAIKLLAMSNLELSQELATIIESNPVLELEFDSDEYADTAAEPERDHLEFRDSAEQSNQLDNLSGSQLGAEAHGDATGESGSASRIEAGEHTDASSEHDFDDSAAAATNDDGGKDLDLEMPEYSDTADLRDWGNGSASGDEDRDGFESRDRAETTLREHLRWQLELTPFSARDRLIAMVLIDSAEDDGYLREPIDYQRAALAPDVMAAAAEIETVRQRLMHFDPIGVLARSLPECLIVQLKDKPHVRRTLAIDMVQTAFEHIARGDCDKLAKQFEVQPCEAAQALKLIRSLNPKPGDGFYVARDEYVIPDVEVRKRNGVWQVLLNPQAQPKLKISPGYEAYAQRAAQKDANYIKTQLADAKQLLKSLAQREDTVLRVAKAILKEQVGFFEHGVEYMKPLVLRQIADACELHESTVSRITTRKYMHTPRGLLEFKHFFSSGVATRDGGEASATAIQEMIRKLIDTEEGRKPLSDSALCDLLKARGVMVARRTVAKYREALNIPSSQERVRHE